MPLISLVFVFCASLFWIDDSLDRTMRERPKTIGVVIYSTMVAAGAVFSYAAFATLFSEEAVRSSTSSSYGWRTSGWDG